MNSTKKYIEQLLDNNDNSRYPDGNVYMAQIIDEIYHLRHNVLLMIELGMIQYPNWRLGQTVFNCLCNIYKTADIQRDTGTDCFHNDSKIPEFITNTFKDKYTVESIEWLIQSIMSKNRDEKVNKGIDEDFDKYDEVFKKLSKK